MCAFACMEFHRYTPAYIHFNSHMRTSVYIYIICMCTCTYMYIHHDAHISLTYHHTFHSHTSNVTRASLQFLPLATTKPSAPAPAPHHPAPATVTVSATIVILTPSLTTTPPYTRHTHVMSTATIVILTPSLDWLPPPSIFVYECLYMYVCIHMYI
jgi:hypothetical protein